MRSWQYVLAESSILIYVALTMFSSGYCNIGNRVVQTNVISITKNAVVRRRERSSYKKRKNNEGVSVSTLCKNVFV